MSKARKTMSVEAFKIECNRRLALPVDRITTEERKAICSLLEHVLFEANAYEGYNDVYWAREGGYDAWKAAGSRDEFPYKCQFFYVRGDGVDDYRRMYY
jgi:hypothetical protein